MKVNFERKRLKAIKSRFVILPTKCDCCGEKFYFEKMWKVSRWGINKTSHDWYYCKNCMPTSEDVLDELDTDEYNFGIAFLDSF